MLQDIWEKFAWMLGANEVASIMPLHQLILRTVIIYVVALMLIRIGKRRFMGGYTPFDILLGFVVGSILSRAITGTVKFFEMICVVGTLMLLHWIISVFTFYSDRFGNALKNSARKLIIDGEIQEDAMQKSKIGKNDLLQALREKGGVESPENVKTAYLERDGNITVITKKGEPKIVEVKVEKGVQIVRIVSE